MNPHKDWLGHPIYPGSRIVYPIRVGSSTDMVLAEVVEIEPAQSYHTLRNFKLKARRLRDTASYKSVGQVVTIEAVERVTVID